MKIMSVDYGDARTGIACCDKGEMMASPVCVITEYSIDRLLVKVAALSTELGAEEIVVGNPINMDGSHGLRSEHCALFAQKLKELVTVPVILWDERGTTITATNYLNQTDTRGKKRKAVIDAVAATIILDNYMLYRKHHRE